MDNRKISVAIPKYNNSEFIKDVLMPILGDERISEIVIVDDNSQDYDKTCSIVKQFDTENKVKTYRNSKRYGIPKNKLEAVKKCNNDWVILLDSDNTIYKNYIDKLFEIKSWQEDTIYCPDFAKPNFNFTKWAGCTFDKDNIKQYLGQPGFDCYPNVCNYFLNKDMYLKNLYDYRNTKVGAADAMLLFTAWLLAGKKTYIVKGMDYLHRVHSNSTTLKSLNKTLVYSKKIQNILKKGEVLPKSFGPIFYIYVHLIAIPLMYIPSFSLEHIKGQTGKIIKSISPKMYIFLKKYF